MKNLSGLFYAYRQERFGAGCSRTIYMHRVIAGAKRGSEADHVNGDTLDNRRENLRTCSVSENRRNYHRRKEGYSSRFKGVTWDKSRGLWAVGIKVDRRRIHVGRFADEIVAAKAYNAAASRLHGVFACPNAIL